MFSNSLHRPARSYQCQCLFTTWCCALLETVPKTLACVLISLWQLFCCGWHIEMDDYNRSVIVLARFTNWRVRQSCQRVAYNKYITDLFDTYRMISNLKSILFVIFVFFPSRYLFFVKNTSSLHSVFAMRLLAVNKHNAAHFTSLFHNYCIFCFQ